VFLPSGTYNLKLASREKAYPDRRKVNRDGTPVGSEAAGEASAIAGTEPSIAASPVRAGRGFPGGAVGMAIAGILATLLVGAIVAALFLRSSPTNREGRQVPQVALEPNHCLIG
ncbi:hypothetical protein AB1L30_00280, partial [Bremerella sp. JC817]|uniref:hypothetical protein n=1 Tax=Bremerella sp. JC817 TaxID=3231756 RepID=UPI003459ABB1